MVLLSQHTAYIFVCHRYFTTIDEFIYFTEKNKQLSVIKVLISNQPRHSNRTTQVQSLDDIKFHFKNNHCLNRERYEGERDSFFYITYPFQQFYKITLKTKVMLSETKFFLTLFFLTITLKYRAAITLYICQYKYMTVTSGGRWRCLKVNIYSLIINYN